MKKAILSALIFILAGQLVALIVWLIFSENYFIILLFSSLVGFVLSYKFKK